MIASIDFQRFKALRATKLAMAPCNLVLGPNGSGKTSLIESMLQLRGLAALAPSGGRAVGQSGSESARDTARPPDRPTADCRAGVLHQPSSKPGPEIAFTFLPPHDAVRVKISCTSDALCNELEITPPNAPAWPALQSSIAKIRSFVLDHIAIASGAGVGAALAPPGIEDRASSGLAPDSRAGDLSQTLSRSNGHQPVPLPTERPVQDTGPADVTGRAQSQVEGLSRDGANLARVLASLKRHAPAEFAALSEDFRRIMPEYSGLSLEPSRSPSPGHATGTAPELGALLVDENKRIAAPEMSQGSLYLLALLAIAHHPNPPSVVCLEEVDRGIHPRLLREVRDILYRLSHPEASGLSRPASQVVATTHSPYLLDLFRNHPEEVVISHKHGSRAHFVRLSDRADLPELLQEGSLGDIWLTGILGGVPSE